jgi:hypothetical protein
MIAAQLRNMIESHALALEGCANNMEAAGVGCANEGGYVTHLRCMAWHLRKSADAGVLPDTYSMVGEREMVEANPTAIKAALETPAVRQVQHLLRKYSLTIDKIETVADFDIKLRAQAAPLHDRIVLKSTLMRAGLLS